MRFGVLGPLEVSNGDGPLPLGGPKQRIVLAHLVLGANQVVPVQRLIDALWGESLPEEPKAALQVYVSRLRSALGQQAIEGRPPGYLLHADPEEVDAFRFEELLREARRGTVDPRLTVGILDEALELWRGPALADLATETSLSGEIARLEELHFQAIEEQIAAKLALGRHADVIAELEALTAAHPLRERVWELLMLALYRSGRQADALTAFQRARELLADELGIDPTADLQTLQEQILRHDPKLDLDGRPLRGYRLLETIGEGSFGVVHRAIQPHVGREVAIKAIVPELANDPGFVRRFDAEAQIIARLESPHIVPLYDYWRDPNGAYLVMRYLSGGSLRRRIEEEGSLALADLTRLTDHVAQALATAHRQGIVHRDVKPENVLLDAEGNGYLTDFGIAKDVSNLQATKTRPPGTPVYLSPEQIRGEGVTARTDVYALGVVVYESLTGRQPFPDGSIATLLHRNLHDPLPSVREIRPELPEVVDQVLARATAKDPGARFAGANELAEAFRGSIGPKAERASAASGTSNPFKGLRPFVEADAEDFFGREALVERLVARLAEGGDGSRLLAVVGPSGSGKSSAVRAGLLPALRHGALEGSAGWFYVEMAPGAHPLEELEAALLRVAVQAPASMLDLLERDERGLHEAVRQALPPDAELVLVIDQLEEVFTLVEDEGERRRFLDGVRAAVTEPDSHVRIVATLRADFYDRPLAYRGVAELVRSRTEPVVPLSPEELERAVAGPAENVGVQVEPAVVAQVVADVAEQPGALPLMQYALTELFDHRSDGVLSAQAYREIGGVSGALARRAEQVFQSTDTAGKQAAEQLFLRLVALGEGTEDTRRRVSRSELDRMGVDGRALDGVIEAFVRHRLLSLDRDPETREPTVEVAHEALLREWQRLRGWIDEARDDLRTERRLAAAAAEWETGGRDPSSLLRGSRLEQLSTWASTTNLALAQAEREYLDESHSRAEAERAAETERTAREAQLERRAIRRLRTAVAIFAFAALVAAGLTVVARNESRRAGREASRAEQQALISSARELAAASVASLETDPQLSVLLAVEAVLSTRSVDGTVLPEAAEALHRSVVASRIELSLPDIGGSVAWSSTGVFVATGVDPFSLGGPHTDGEVDIRDAETGDIVSSFPGHDGDIKEVAFSGDGSVMATAGTDGVLKVWDPATGDLRASASGHGEAFAVSLSEDGSFAAGLTGPEGGGPVKLRILEVDSEEVRTESVLSVNDLAVSPDGTRIAVAGASIPVDVLLIDIATGDVVTLEGGDVEHSFTSVSWSLDGRYVAAGGFDNRAKVWDLATGRGFTLDGHTDSTHWVDWGTHPTRLVTGSLDGTARVWDIQRDGAQQLFTLSGSEGPVSGVAFSPDGREVMTSVGTEAVQIWDVGQGGDAEVANLSRLLGDLVFTQDGRHVVETHDGSLARWDLDAGSRHSIGSIDPSSDIEAVDMSLDGRSVAYRYEDGTMIVRDVATREVEYSIDGPVADTSWSPDGAHLAATSRGSVAVYDLDGNARLLRQDDVEILRAWFGPADLIATLAQGADEEVVRFEIWDADRGEIVTRIGAETGAFSGDSPLIYDWGDDLSGVAFHPRGDRIATQRGGTIEIWDVSSGELITPLPELPADIGYMTFNPDGSRLAVGTVDGAVRLFDGGTFEQLLLVRGHQAAVDRLVFSADGSRLASQDSNGMVRVWALDIDDLLEIARQNVTRSLTDEECSQYLHVAACS